MKVSKRKYYTGRFFTVLIMMLTLGWLTISLPFVNGARQHAIQCAKEQQSKQAGNSADPFGNTTEEKNPSSSNTIAEEFLHEQDIQPGTYPSSIQYNKSNPATDYTAFHGELLSPPPDIS